MPLIVRWPGVAKPGLVVGEPVTSTDFYPTCLAAAGLPALPHQHQDGVDLQPVLAGAGSLPARSLFWHYPHYNEHPCSVPSSVIRKGPWKLIETFDPEGIELYHLTDDLSEANNLATDPAQTPLRTDLSQKLDQMLAARITVKPDAVTTPTKKRKKKQP